MKKRVFGILGYSLLFFILLSICTISWIILLFKTPSRNEISDIGHQYYQYLRVNLVTKEINIGIAAYDSKLINNFLSFRDDKENMYLLSELGSDEYFCSGSCVCEDPINEDRRATSVVSMSVFYLVAAVSTIFAIEKATENLEEECLEKMSPSCNSISFIRTQITCKSILRKDGEEAQDEKEPTPEIETREFFCRGHCLSSGYLRSEKTIEMSKKYGCEKLETEGNVEIEDRSFRDPEVPLRIAKKKFHADYLRKYCREASHDSFFYFSPTGGSKGWREVSMCQSTVKNPTISCRQVSGRGQLFLFSDEWL